MNSKTLITLEAIKLRTSSTFFRLNFPVKSLLMLLNYLAQCLRFARSIQCVSKMRDVIDKGYKGRLERKEQ